MKEPEIIVLKVSPVQAFSVKVKCPHSECMDGDSSYEWTEVVTKSTNYVECANCEAVIRVRFKKISESYIKTL